MSLLKRLLLVASMAAVATLAFPLASRAGTQGLEKRQECGFAVCTADESCCNPMCSMCARPGVFCTQQDCGHLSPGYSPGVPPPSPTSTVDAAPTSPTTLVPLPYPSGGNDGDDDGDNGLVACGRNKCAKGNYCCNHSCGICAPAGGACIQLFCVDGELPSSD